MGYSCSLSSRRISGRCEHSRRIMLQQIFISMALRLRATYTPPLNAKGRKIYGAAVAGVGEGGRWVFVTVGVRVGDGVREGVKVGVGIAVGASPCKIN